MLKTFLFWYVLFLGDRTVSLDPAVADQLTAQLIAGVNQSNQLTAMADRNLTQGLGVINSTLIQQHGGVADDSAQFAALAAADRTPVPRGQ